MSAPAQSQGEADYSVVFAGNKDPPVPWFQKDVRSRISPQIRDLLTKNYNVPADSVDDHCQRIRDTAWDIRAYPCIGMGVFLYPPILPQHPGFAHVLETWTEHSSFLDIGAFLGIEPRALASTLCERGVTDPARQIYQLDVVDFQAVGLDFFHDRGSSFAHRERYILADFLGDTSAPPLKGLEHGFSVVNIGQVLHQFDLDAMTTATERLVYFTRLEVGSVIMGNQIGNGQKARTWTQGKTTTWQHDVGSFGEMIQEVGKRTGTKWHIHAEWRDVEDVGWPREVVQFLGDGAGLLLFWCELLETGGS